MQNKFTRIKNWLVHGVLAIVIVIVVLGIYHGWHDVELIAFWRKPLAQISIGEFISLLIISRVVWISLSNKEDKEEE